MLEEHFYKDFQKKTRWTIECFAKTRHLDFEIRDYILKNPEKITEYVPDDYRGEHFYKDFIEDMPNKPSEEFVETYSKAYLKGYKRGIGRCYE
jgi:hypothetical protein